MEENEIYVTNNGQGYTPMGGERQPKDKGGRYFWVGLFTGLIIALITTGSVYAVSRIQYADAIKKLEANQKDKDNNKNKDNNKDGSDSSGEWDHEISEDTVEKMDLIESIIEENYYKDEDIDREAMENGAYKGMVSSLGDPYSEYYSAEELQSLYQSTAGIYYGIGAYVSLDEATKYGKISGIIEGTPAEEADLRENDIIYKVDGKDVYGMTLTEIVSLVKGEENTTVRLTLVRDGVQIEKAVVRRKVEAPTVKFEMLDDDIAYIQITEFDTITIQQFTEAMAMARGNNMKGLVLDLRSNPGGSLASVISIARQLLPEGLIVYTEDKYGERAEYKSDGKRVIDVPMVVLVNGNSASASEILAGAIKDYGVGYLIGTTTFGKGIVQKPIELSDGSAVKLTISSYYTPKGVNIHGIGIEPDEVIEFDSELYYSDEKIDNQLERAKEYLQERIN